MVSLQLMPPLPLAGKTSCGSPHSSDALHQPNGPFHVDGIICNKICILRNREALAPRFESLLGRKDYTRVDSIVQNFGRRIIIAAAQSSFAAALRCAFPAAGGC